MERASTWLRFSLAVAVCLGMTAPLPALIENPLPLKDILGTMHYILVAKVASVDAAKPAAVLMVDQDLKGKAPFRRIPVNLTGDKENHTPQLLKRIAPDVPLILFVLDREKDYVALGYTNGTWLQILGYKDGDSVRWAFTHCEIYLRRTYKGTTAELQQVVVDALAKKKNPPPHNPKERPGFGPELETKPPEKKCTIAPWPEGAFVRGVIVLPFAMPIAALLQLLFPGILRDQWRNYKVAVYLLLTQSTLIFAHWAIARWLVSEPGQAWWLKDSVWWTASVALMFTGGVVAVLRLRRVPELAALKPPVRVEYLALGMLLLFGLLWGGWQYWNVTPPFRDEMGIVTIAAAAGLGHLALRRVRGSQAPRRALVTTEAVFVWGMALAGIAIGLVVFGPEPANVIGNQVRSDWPVFRGNPARTGSLDPADPGPKQPRVLWSFQPGERYGRVIIHSSPTVVDDQIYIGALNNILTLAKGYVYCINAATGREAGSAPLKPGDRLWRFSANDALKPVFSSASVANGRIYIGEGYHQDQNCRLLCLDAASGQLIWSRPTASHVESSPCIDGSRVYFGAGDDGIICVDESVLEASPDGPPSPRTIWQVRGYHVDADPLLVGDLLYAGCVVGDIERELCALAVDIRTGQIAWKTPAPLPVPASPAYANGRVFFGLGNGKMTEDADNPQGAIWCLDAKTGARLWQVDVASSVLGVPVLDKEHVYFGARNGFCYCLNQQDGAVVWKKDLKSPISASLVLAGGKIYGLTVDGKVFALAAADGQEIWKLLELQEHADDQAVSSPMLAKGKLFVAVGSQVFCIGDP